MKSITFLSLIGSYLLGSVPTGYWMGKYLKGIDIRTVGSGNLGATNVFRAVGKTAGLFTLLIDSLKGFIPVYLSLKVFGWGEVISSLMGIAAIAGHNWTLFLGFKGGKGVATSAGVFMALAPIPTCIALGVFSVVLACTRHVSVGSLSGAFSLPITVGFLHYSKFLTILSSFCAILILFLHKKNVVRLIHGEEHKIGF